MHDLTMTSTMRRSVLAVTATFLVVCLATTTTTVYAGLDTGIPLPSGRDEEQQQGLLKETEHDVPDGTEADEEGDTDGDQTPPCGCRWGETCSNSECREGIAGNQSSLVMEDNTEREDVNVKDDGTDVNDDSGRSNTSLPFVSFASMRGNERHTSTTASTTTSSSSPSPSSFEPPEGFVLTARVYTDPHTNEAVLEKDNPNAFLPYYDCGVLGSTTAVLPNDAAVVRHAISSTTPIRREGKPPPAQLLIALSPMELELSSTIMSPSSSSSSGAAAAATGAATVAGNDSDNNDHTQNDGNQDKTKKNVCVLEAGSVVLLEDTMPCEHTCRPLHDDLTMLIMTLSVSSTSSSRRHNGRNNGGGRHGHQPPCSIVSNNDPGVVPDDDENDRPFRRRRRSGQQPRLWLPPRKWVLGGIGVSLTALLADFLGKVAPLWLSVGVGGTCFVAGGTVAFVQSTDQLCEHIEWYWRTRKHVKQLQKRQQQQRDKDKEATNDNEGKATAEKKDEPKITLETATEGLFPGADIATDEPIGVMAR